MKMMLLFLLLVAGCGVPVENIPSRPKKDSLINQVSLETLIELRKEFELQACGFDARAMDQIKVLGLSFDYYKELDIDGARTLVVLAAMRFLKKINENEAIRLLLERFPFKSENVRIRIFFRYPKNSISNDNKLQVVSLIDGILSYKITDPETRLLKTIKEETFEEALLCIPQPA